MNDIVNWPRLSIIPINDNYDQEKIFDIIFPQSLKEIDGVVNQILQSKVDRIDDKKNEGFLESLDPLIDKFSLDITSHTQECLLAIACVKALIIQPTPLLWRIIQKIKYYTYFLEYILADYCIQACVDSLDTRNKFIILSNEIINEYIQCDIHFNSERVFQQFINIKHNWNEDWKLSSIWNGLHNSGNIIHDGDNAIFKISYQLDAVQFLALTNKFCDPYSTLIAIHSTGVYYSLSTWSNLLTISPIAFDDTYEWNKSFILPLLLDIAYGEINFATSQILTHTTVEQIAAIKADIDSLVQHIINLVVHSGDGIHNVALIRWATWLISKLTNQGPTELSSDHNEIHSNNNYLPAKFLYEIATCIPPNFFDLKISEIKEIDKLSKENINTLIWTGAEEWENWAFHALISHFCLIEKTDTLLLSNLSNKFFKEWKIGPITWYDHKGRFLRNCATQFIPYKTDNFPNYGIQLLAYTFFNSEHPEIHWLNLLYGTNYLHEIIEYAPYYLLDGEKFKNGQQARYLMQLVAGIGITLIDFFSNETDLTEENKISAQKIYSSLSDTLWSLRRIDKVNSEFWEKSLNYTILRRAYFGEDRIAENNPKIFDENTFPTFKDQISYLKYDTRPLINIINLALINGIAPEALKATLTEIGLDLKVEIAKTIRLNQLQPNKYPMNPTVLDKLSRL